MNALKNVALLTLVIGLYSCASSNKSVLPLSNKLLLEDTYTIIWNGTSEAYRFVEGKWIRDEKYDYQFSVIQKRYDKQWKSIKSMHRIHPDYDGKAGERDQTMYFEVGYTALKGDTVTSIIRSSLGDGNGKTDREFREAQLLMKVKKPSSFLPYTNYRITQHYKYEEGVLTETVELFKEEDGKEIPFMKNEEKAYIYLKGHLTQAPTQYKD